MYEYLEEHAYISKNKKSNYQFELTRERAECIANKYNNLCEEKDTEIERLNNIINELEQWVEEKFKIENTQYYYVIDANDLKRKIKELKGSGK